MPKTREQKAEALQILGEAFKRGKSMVFTDYQGMTVSKITELRKKLHASQGDYVVAKKTLLALAAKQAGYELNFKSLPGMIGVAFANEDEMAPAKIIGQTGKDQPIKLVGGIFEGKMVDQAYVTVLSMLPTRAQLLGQLLSVFNGPIGGFVRVLHAHQEKQSGGATVVPEVAVVA